MSAESPNDTPNSAVLIQHRRFETHFSPLIATPELVVTKLAVFFTSEMLDNFLANPEQSALTTHSQKRNVR